MDTQPPTDAAPPAGATAAARVAAQVPPPLFHYHHRSGTESLGDRPLAVIDLETTGFAPGTDRGDRVVEVAVVRVLPDGSIEDEWSTLLDPGRDVGPTWVHRISQEMVLGAPRFGDVAGDLIDRLDGAVVVAHNASFEDGFLSWEFANAGIAMPQLPALCTMRLARRRLDTPNVKLATCCEALGLVNDGAHSALGDARVTASLALALLGAGPELLWRSAPPALPAGAHGVAQPRPVG